MVTWIQELIELSKKGELDKLKLWDRLGVDTIDIERTFGPRIAADLLESTKHERVTVEQTVFPLLALTSFTLGRYCRLIDGQLETRPGVYSLIVAPSGSSKSPLSKWLHKNTINLWNYQFAKYNALQIEALSKAKVTEKFVNKQGEEEERQRPMTKNEIKFRREEMIKEEICPSISNANIPALQISLKNSACYLFYDEAKVFIKQFCPGRVGDPNDQLDFLTEMHTKEDYIIRRVTETRKLLDINLAMLLTGTPASFSKLLDKDFIEGGGLWRFDCYVAEQDFDEPENVLTEEFLLQPRRSPKQPVEIENMLHRLFKKNFILDFDEVTQLSFVEAEILEFGYVPVKPRTRTNKHNYCYSIEAQEYKDVLYNFFVKFCQAEFNKKGFSHMAAMVAKIPERIDKYAMILQAIRNDMGVEQTVHSLATPGAIEVSLETLESAVEIARMIIRGWSNMQSLSEKRSAEEEQHLKKKKKKKKFPSAIKHFIALFEITDPKRPISLEQVRAELPKRLAAYNGLGSSQSKANEKMNILKLLNPDNDNEFVQFLDSDKKTFVLNVDL